MSGKTQTIELVHYILHTDRISICIPVTIELFQSIRVVNEEPLKIALKTRQIAGAATNIFLYKPTGPENSVLLGSECSEPKDLNLVVIPYYSAWFIANPRLDDTACYIALGGRVRETLRFHNYSYQSALQRNKDITFTILYSADSI